MDAKAALSVLLVVASFLLGACLYPYLPDTVASHWGSHGEVNGYLPKSWGVFMLPSITGFILLMFYLIPSIDPLKENIRAFRGHYDSFALIFTAFMTLVFVQTLLWNVGTRINPLAVISAGLFVLFYYSGVLLEHAKRNWFIGIRTPWTLSSDIVWEKTHRVGGRMFKACGLIALAGAFFPEYAIALILIPLLATSAYLTGYSYLEYRRLPP